MRHNKLVRDKIPEIIKAKGEVCSMHIASDDEYEEKLFQKLREESEELICDKTIGEVADVLEVIDAIVALKGFSKEEVMQVKKEKKESRGGFSSRIILEKS